MEKPHMSHTVLDLNNEREFTESGVRRFLASQHNLMNAYAVQLRVTHGSLAYFAEEPCVSEKCLKEHALVFESWHVSYIGKAAAENDQWVAEVFNGLKAVWQKYCREGTIFPEKAHFIDIW